VTQEDPDAVGWEIGSGQGRGTRCGGMGGRKRGGRGNGPPVTITFGFFLVIEIKKI
jgi:hypothetical protein